LNRLDVPVTIIQAMLKNRILNLNNLILIKLLILFSGIIAILVQLLSCSNERRESIDYSIDKIENIDTTLNHFSRNRGSLKTVSDSTEQIQMIVDSTTNADKITTDMYPKRKFITNTGEKDSAYFAYEWAITFFIENGQKEELDQFRKIGFPMEWWASGQCSYYPVHVDSVSYFLNLAGKIGYKDYGFDCNNTDNQDFDAALSNSIETRLVSGQNVESIALDYGLDIKQEVSPRFFLLRTIDKSAEDLINTVKRLNNDERIVKASFTFKRCN